MLALDVGNNQQNYLTVNPGLTERGTVAFQLINRTSRPLTNIKLGITASGNESVSNVSGTLPPGKSTIIDTGKRMTKAQADALQVRVVDVSVAQ